MVKKIALIGAGNIGGTLAHLIVLKQLANIVLFDVTMEIAQGKALDLTQGATLEGSDIKITATNNYSELAGSDVIVVTAGMPRKPGMSRDDLLITNAKIIRTVGMAIKNYCQHAFVVCVTNPLDVMVKVLQDYSHISDHMIVGMAGILDSARFRSFLAEEFRVSRREVQAYVLGGHGDTMVPLTNLSSVAGVSLDALVKQGKITQARLHEIIERTRNGGSEIVSLLKHGSAYYAPASSILQIVESYLLDQKRILPCAAKVHPGQYGVDSPMFVGVPVKIGSCGVEEIVEFKLSNHEHASLEKSIQTVKELNKTLSGIDLNVAL